MIGHCISQGLRSARRAPGLVALLWCWTLTLAALAAYPAWLWLGRAFNLAPESDRMLTGFNLGVFSELAQYDRSPIQGIVMASLVGVVLLAILANPFLSGGLIEALLAHDEATILQRFFRGAGHYFWRYLRLLIYGLITAVLAMLILSPVFTVTSRSLQDSPWEPAPVVGSAVQMIVLLVVGALLLLTLDFARIRTAVDESRRTLRIWISSFGFVLRRIPAAFGIFVVPVAIFALVAALYAVFCTYTPSHTWLLILVTILVQQIVMYIRTGLRVALVASELEYFRAACPPPAMVPVEAVPAAPAPSPDTSTQEAIGPAQENVEAKTVDGPTCFLIFFS